MTQAEEIRQTYDLLDGDIEATAETLDLAASVVATLLGHDTDPQPPEPPSTSRPTFTDTHIALKGTERGVQCSCGYWSPLGHEGGYFHRNKDKRIRLRCAGCKDSVLLLNLEII